METEEFYEMWDAIPLEAGIAKINDECKERKDKL